MRFPPGVDRETAIFGYMQALQGFPISAIAYGIQRFLRGECDGVKPKYCPLPPELAGIVRETLRQQKPSAPTGKIHGYHVPKSKIVERGCTKDFARQLVRNGRAPKGSIWCPGMFGENPVKGDLYGPDPDWKGPWEINQTAAE